MKSGAFLWFGWVGVVVTNEIQVLASISSAHVDRSVAGTTVMPALSLADNVKNRPKTCLKSAGFLVRSTLFHPVAGLEPF